MAGSCPRTRGLGGAPEPRFVASIRRPTQLGVALLMEHDMLAVSATATTTNSDGINPSSAEFA